MKTRNEAKKYGFDFIFQMQNELKKEATTN